MIKTIEGYNVLWTKGEKEPITNNRYDIKDIYNSHLWIHNGQIEKNHTKLTPDKIQEMISMDHDVKEYIGVVTDEWDNDSIGYNISTDLEDMKRWKSDMDGCNDVKECVIYKVIKESI